MEKDWKFNILIKVESRFIQANSRSIEKIPIKIIQDQSLIDKNHMSFIEDEKIQNNYFQDSFFSSFGSQISSSIEDKNQNEDLPFIQEDLLSNGYYAALFEHVQQLGEGGFGSVQLARHKLDGQLYAIKRQQLKILSSQDVKSHFLLNQVKALVSLQSKYIVRYSTCWTQLYQSTNESESSFSDSTKSDTSIQGEYQQISLYIQMEYCRGHSLKQWLEDPQREINHLFNQKLFKQIAKGVSFIHQKEILHRDLKPANILLDQNQNAKIADFNLAINKSEAYSKTNVGTPIYSAPEQLKNKPCDFKADIFSLGVILVEMYSKFSTQHQRLIELGKARKGELPFQFVQLYPQQAVLAGWLLHPSPKSRPSAEEVCRFIKGTNQLQKWPILDHWVLL